MRPERLSLGTDTVSMNLSKIDVHLRLVTEKNLAISWQACVTGCPNQNTPNIPLHARRQL